MFVGRIRSAALWLTRKRLFKRNSSSANEQPAAYEEKPGDLGPKKKPFKPPFLKNIFVGNYDKDILLYPEVVDIDEVKVKMIEKMQMAPSKDSDLTSLSVADKVKSLFKSGLPLVSDDDYFDSERANIYEALAVDLPTALLMDTQTMVIEMISKYGSDLIKQKYLPGLKSGALTGAFAMSEASTGSDPSNLSAVAEHNVINGSFELTGVKEWVTNGRNADVFIVLAHVTRSSHLRKEVSAFVVDKDAGGIVRTDQPSHELHECGFSQIQFDQTPVPDKNLLGDVGSGFDVACQCITHNRYFVITSLLNILKNTLNDVNATVKTRKQYPQDLKDCELIQYKLSQIGCSIYALESTLYLYCGMNDAYNMETLVEAASLQLLCYQTALDCMTTCNEILGGRSYLGTTDYMKTISQVQGLILACKTTSLLKMYVSLQSLYYAAIALQENIRKHRNPFDFPGFVVKRMIQNHKHSADNPKLSLKLYMQLHPSLKPAAEILEYSVLRLQYAIELHLSRYGTDAVNKQVDLYRMAEVATDIFAMTAVISRASRSYCTGIKFCDQEILFANAFCHEAQHRVRLAILRIVEGGITSNDVGMLKIGTEMINLGGYFPTHPLHRNIK